MELPRLLPPRMLGRLPTRPARASRRAFPRLSPGCPARTTPCLPRLPQGLGDGPFYFVMYCWAFALYCAFVAVFCTFGGLIGLRIFTLNSYSLQVCLRSIALALPAPCRASASCSRLRCVVLQPHAPARASLLPAGHTPEAFTSHAPCLFGLHVCPTAADLAAHASPATLIPWPFSVSWNACIYWCHPRHSSRCICPAPSVPQAVFYLAWGLCLTSWSFYFSALWEEARPAVLLCVIWVIISGQVGPRWIGPQPACFANCPPPQDRPPRLRLLTLHRPSRRCANRRHLQTELYKIDAIDCCSPAS